MCVLVQFQANPVVTHYKKKAKKRAVNFRPYSLLLFLFLVSSFLLLPRSSPTLSVPPRFLRLFLAPHKQTFIFSHFCACFFCCLLRPLLFALFASIVAIVAVTATTTNINNNGLCATETSKVSLLSPPSLALRLFLSSSLFLPSCRSSPLPRCLSSPSSRSLTTAHCAHKKKQLHTSISNNFCLCFSCCLSLASSCAACCFSCNLHQVKQTNVW